MPRLKPSTTAYSKEKSNMKKALKKIGATNIKISNGYYFFSGFATLPNGVIIYFSYDAESIMKDKILIREALDYNDYGNSHSYNTFTKGKSVKNIIEHIEKKFLNK
jgi:hypothetical protein